MKGFFLIGLFALLLGCDSVRSLNGYYEDQYIRPDVSVLFFDSNFLFEEYVHTDLKSYYSRGSYLLNGNKLILNFDSIYTDSTLIIDNEIGNSDSIEIKLLLYEDIALDTNMIIYSGADSGVYYRIPEYIWWKSKALFEIPLQIDVRVPRGENNITTLKIFDGMKRFIYDIVIETTDFNYLKVEYFPSGGRMRFNDDGDEIIKLKKVDTNLIEFKYLSNGLIQGYKPLPSSLK